MVDNTTSAKVFVPTPENLAYLEGLADIGRHIRRELKWRGDLRADPKESHRHDFLDGCIAALEDLERYTDDCIEYGLEEA